MLQNHTFVHTLWLVQRIIFPLVLIYIIKQEHKKLRKLVPSKWWRIGQMNKKLKGKLIVFPCTLFMSFGCCFLWMRDFLMYFNIIICGVPPPYAAIKVLENTIHRRRHAIQLWILLCRLYTLLACLRRTNPKLYWSNWVKKTGGVIWDCVE